VTDLKEDVECLYTLPVTVMHRLRRVRSENEIIFESQIIFK
jgi:hypothetical protein